jgi:hypothetical protein
LRLIDSAVSKLTWRIFIPFPCEWCGS